MSDENTDTPAENVEQAKPVEELGEGGKKALQAERDARKRAEDEAKALRARLDDIEAANMTELEKAQKAARDAQAELSALQLESLRHRVALEKGLPANLVDRLRGESEADIAADADALLALVNAPRSPMPDPTQGSKGEAAPATPEQAFVDFANNF